jgi:polyferredoxin
MQRTVAHRTAMRHARAPSVGEPRIELTRVRWLRHWLTRRSWQFQVTLPNQVLFWVVIVVGLVGPDDPTLNFATAITWYVWFCLVFVLIVTTGRGWCAVCPFGGLAEWLQRRSLWFRPGARGWGLNLPVPERVARFGYLLPVAAFGLLTWIEEFLGIAGPGDPPLTSGLVIGIILLAVVSFLVLERRSFCRYLCPLSGLIGVLGLQAPVAGFRARDPRVCKTCPTKACLRGDPGSGHGCPWLTWPGNARTNLSCGLCGECLRTCPEGNVGLYVTPALSGIVRPGRRRADVAWSVAGLAAIVIYQQLNATTAYTALDDSLDAATDVPHYPNPVAYLGVIALVTALAAVPAVLAARLLGRADLPVDGRDVPFIHRRTRFRAFFLPLMYAAVPLVGADYLARQLPKFMNHAASVIPAAGRLVGLGGAGARLLHQGMGGTTTVVAVQLAVVAVGTAGSVVAGRRIARAELAPASRAPAVVPAATTALLLTAGLLIGALYVVIGAAE